MNAARSSGVDTQIDRDNCGACVSKCSAGKSVRAERVAHRARRGRVCACSMAAPRTAPTPQATTRICGGCVLSCDAKHVCSEGQCSSTCSSTQTLCDAAAGAYCAPVSTDNANAAMRNRLRRATFARRVHAPPPAGPVSSRARLTEGRTAPTPRRITPTAVRARTRAAHSRRAQPVCVNQPARTRRHKCVPDGGSPFCTSTSVDHENCGLCERACAPAAYCTGSNCWCPYPNLRLR